MTNPTKQYALGFNAYAFLKPKHLPEDALLDWVPDDELKKLKPSPQAVRDAIVECKKHGLTARFSAGLALSVSGTTEDLRTCFGVRLALAIDDDASPSQWFESDDTAANVLGSAKPVSGHPLEKHIVSLVVDEGAETGDAPKYPDASVTGDWGKLQADHVWPDELYGRLSNDSTHEPIYRDRVKELSHSVGYGFSVALIDSGLNGLHTYFMEDRNVHKLEGRVNLKPRTENYAFSWPTTIELKAKIEANIVKQARITMRDQVQSSQTEIKNLVTLICGFQRALWIPVYGVGEVTEVRFTKIHIRDNAYTTYPDIGNAAKIIRTSKYWKEFISRNRAPSLVQLLWTLQERRYDPLSLTKRPQRMQPRDFYHSTVFAHLELFEKFMINVENRIDNDVGRWVFRYGQDHYDYDGHGTGMAASILGVAGKAHIASFPALKADATKTFNELIGAREASLDLVFHDASQWALEKDKVAKQAVDRGELDTRGIVEYRIMSNSYGRGINIDTQGKTSPEDMKILNDWRKRIDRLCNDQGFSILFSAGNNGRPAKPQISWGAFLGGAGAIIVGGAFDPGESPRQVYLSDAAHGEVVKNPWYKVKNPWYKKSGFFSKNKSPKEITIPDVCGIVGPMLPGHGAAYVYIPSMEKNNPGNNDYWHYYGGGTSSACAQIAGLCGALRARWRNMTPKQAKDAIIRGGDALIEPPHLPHPEWGLSYQGKKPSELLVTTTYEKGDMVDGNKMSKKGERVEPVALANVIGAFQAAMQIMRTNL